MKDTLRALILGFIRYPGVSAIGMLSYGLTLIVTLALYLQFGADERLILPLVVLFISSLYALSHFQAFIQQGRERFQSSRHRLKIALILFRSACIAGIVYSYELDFDFQILCIIGLLGASDMMLVSLPQKKLYPLIVVNSLLIALAASQSLFQISVLWFCAFCIQIYVYLTQNEFLKISGRSRRLNSLNKEIASLTKDKERLRLKRDLHDHLGHELTALNIEIALMQNAPKGDSPLSSLATRSKRINQLLRSIISDEHQDTQLTLGQMISHYSQQAVGLTVKTQIDHPELRLEPEKTKLLSSTVLEIMTNAMKYSHDATLNIAFTVSNSS